MSEKEILKRKAIRAIDNILLSKTLNYADTLDTLKEVQAAALKEIERLKSSLERSKAA